MEDSPQVVISQIRKLISSSEVSINSNALSAELNQLLDTLEARISSDFNNLELKRLIDSLPAMVGYWDKNLLNVLSNQAYDDYFGKKASEIRGKNIESLLGPELFGKNKKFIDDVLRGEPQIFERDIPQPNGVVKHTLAHYIPDFKDNEVVGFFVIVTDISRSKELELERRGLEAKLIHASKMSSLGEMASGIAHEINNPLVIVYGKASLIKMQIENGTANLNKIKDDLTQIEMTSDLIAKIVKSLRSFARDSEHDPWETVNVKRVMDETLIFCSERFKNHGVDLVINYECDVSFQSRASQISQIILNLLNNSFDAVSALPNKWVKVNISADNYLLKIRVMDSGTGIPKMIADKMMMPFFTTKEIGKGTGLGLSISKVISEKHNGKLYYDFLSEHTSFVLELPISQPS